MYQKLVTHPSVCDFSSPLPSNPRIRRTGGKIPADLFHSLSKQAKKVNENTNPEKTA